MPDSIQPRRLNRSPRARLLALAALMSAILVAGCVGSSPSRVPGAGATSSGSTAPGAYGSGPIGFSRCMRANGVPNFPDPSLHTCWKQSRGARVQGGAGEVPEDPAGRRRAPQLGAPSLHADAVEAAQDRAVHAPARSPPVPRSDDLARVQPSRYPRDHQLRRSDPCVSGHDRFASAGIQAGLGHVRCPATWPPSLMGTGIAAASPA
jgi:hypothetical protein